VVSKWLTELLSRKLGYLIHMDCCHPVCVREGVQDHQCDQQRRIILVEKCAYGCEICLSVLVMDEREV
jgi:hypothetical protein